MQVHHIMKNLYIIIVATSLLLQACQQGEGPLNTLEHKKAELARLKTQLQTMGDEIALLEQEIQDMDTTVRVEKARLVKLEEAVPTTFTHYIDIQGRISAEDEMMISPRTAGTVSSISVKAGSQVKAGQVIGRLDDAIIRQNVAVVENQLAFATDLYNKQKALWDQNIGTEVQYLSAQNNVETIKKQIKALLEQQDLNLIKSPISGVIDEVFFKIGQTVAPGSPCVRVINLSRLTAKAEVAEAFAGKIREGNPVVVDIPDLNRQIQTRLSYIGKTINPVGRTFGVQSILKTDPALMPNMIAILRIIDYQKTQAVVVPVNYIQKDGQGSFVFVAQQEGERWVAHKKPVTTGQIYDKSAEILTGIQAGDRVITVGYLEVNEGELLSIIQ